MNFPLKTKEKALIVAVPEFGTLRRCNELMIIVSALLMFAQRTL